jgi:hypothetical protein
VQEGCHIEAATLFYDDLDHMLQQKLGFDQNMYDPCVYNRVEDKDKVTVRVHVDDIKISSCSKLQLDKVVRELREVYGEITEHVGIGHDYLGMILSYHPDERKISLNMKKYIGACIEGFEEENNVQIKKVLTPASSNLFKIRNDSEREILKEKHKSEFHSTVAKLLFVAKRGRPVILLAESFLTTRVQNPDLDDWKELIRILGYLKETLDLELTISCSSLDSLTWYIDGSYAVLLYILA